MMAGLSNMVLAGISFRKKHVYIEKKKKRKKLDAYLNFALSSRDIVSVQVVFSMY